MLAELKDSDFRLFRELIYEKSGISLNDTKKELLRSRLRSRLEREGYKSYREYYDFVKSDRTSTELVKLLDNISTNLTSFFREINHFHFLEKEIPPWIVKKQKKGETEFRIWSAGCSTGEEPYTLAFVMIGFLAGKMASWNLKILATDLSTDVLKRAYGGVYEESRIQNISKSKMRDYFDKDTVDGTTKVLRVKPEIRNLITFKRFNLMNTTFPFKHKFDFIFCRNVMIYFDKPTQEVLVAKYYQHLQPGGYLFIGHSESLTGVDHSFKYVQPTVYQKKG